MFASNCVLEEDGNVIIFSLVGEGGGYGNLKTDLVFLQEKLNGQIYIDNVINNSIVPLFAAQPQLTLMLDGAIPHTARIVADHLANLGIVVLPWP